MFRDLLPASEKRFTAEDGAAEKKLSIWISLRLTLLGF
jgi:hypothetical protein